MYFEVLGSLTVTGDNGSQVRLAGGRMRVVLAVLCADAGHVVSRDRLIHITWNGAPPATAAAQLHSLVSGLRRAFGRGRETIVTRPEGYLLRAGSDDVDLARLRSLITRSRQYGDRGALDEAAALLSDAVALWHGRPFSGFDSLELTAVADLAEQDYVSVLEDYARVELLRGNHAALVPRLAEWVAAYPLREKLRGSYITALARSGRQAEAIATYRDLERILAEELGIDPGQDIQRQYQQVLTGHESPAGQFSSVPVTSEGQAPVTGAAPAQLPVVSADFTGREEEVRALKTALVRGDGSRPGPAIAVVVGMAGVGKSALAVRVAHAVAAEYPDGQLYVNMAGLSGRPAAPARVLARLLRDLGVKARDVPDDLEECAGRFRSMLRGRRVLVVLDDARDTAQVQPLLPGTPGSAVLVTSRAEFADLPGAHRVDLGALSEDEAHEMFARVVGRRRVDAEPAAAARILHACTGLPLAIRIISARLAARPGWMLEPVARRLATERGRLTELHSGALSVRASLTLSLNALDGGAARVFRLLGLAPPGLLGLDAVAVLSGITAACAEKVLDALIEARMIESPAHSRYRLHGLLRSFAVCLAAESLDLHERDTHLLALVTWYASGLRAALDVLAPGQLLARAWRVTLGTADPPVPAFGSWGDAQGWLREEQRHLVWAARAAVTLDRHDLAAALSAMLSSVTRATQPDAGVASATLGQKGQSVPTSDSTPVV